MSEFMSDDACEENQSSDQPEHDRAAVAELGRKERCESDSGSDHEGIDDEPARVDADLDASDAAELPRPSKTHAFYVVSGVTRLHPPPTVAASRRLAML